MTNAESRNATDTGAQDTAKETAGSDEVTKCIVAFGASITRGYGVAPGAGWVELLSDLLRKDLGDKAIPVFNAGGNGNTSAEGLKRITPDVLSHMPGLVLVQFGGNDAVHDSRAVSLQDFERNLAEISDKIKSTGGETVFVTFPPIINAWHSCCSDPHYAKWGGLDQCVEEYRQKTRDMAEKLGCAVFDLDKFLRRLIAEKGPVPYIVKDGVHLTVEANRVVAEAMRDFLKKINRIA